MRALALLAALAWATPASDAGPAIGRFLISKPHVGGFFAETVIVLVDHSEAGSLGLIVNRPIGLSLAELLPELAGTHGHDEPGFLGGPVAPRELLLLVRAGSQPPGAAPVLAHLFVSGSRDTLRMLLEKAPKGSEFRAYVGYTGWAPGQLEAEIARGDWLLAPGDAASVFTHEPAELWQTLWKRHQMIPVRAPAGDPVVAAFAKSINLSPPWRSAAASSASPTSGRARSSTR